VLLDGSGQVVKTWIGLVDVKEFRGSFDGLIEE